MSMVGAMLSCKCPRCRQGDLFEHAAVSAKYTKMHRYCPRCGFDLEPEPGFYFGAMYISYAFNIAIFVTAFLFTLIVFDPEPLWVYFVAVLLPAALFLPFNFRLSRSIYLHLFGHGGGYDPQAPLRP